MPFADSLAEYSAAQIVAALGCPRQTAYAWLDGSRQPPAWLQPHLLAIIARGTRKRHNKTQHRTDASGKVAGRGDV